MLSSSWLAGGVGGAAGLDRAAVAVQSLLGWQLGQRTLFDGVRKLDPGAIARLGRDGVHVQRPTSRTGDPIEPRGGGARGGCLLRTSLNALLDDHPDAVLQLTGGMDSRLLLSAIPGGGAAGFGP